MDTEKWLPVINEIGRYEVSNFGRVRSVDRMTSAEWRGTTVHRRYKGRILSASIGSHGYMSIGFRHAHRLVHHIVLESFVGERPKGAYACHGDGDKTNNKLSNLRWASPTENCMDADRHGTKAMGERMGGAKLTESDVRRIRVLSKACSRNELSKIFGVHIVTIADVLTGKTWVHVDHC